jgi:predicted nucleotidyltransferase
LNIEEIIKLLKLNKSMLLKKYGVKDIAVFGSYTSGNQRIDSDLDIMVDIKKEYRTFDNFMDLKFFLEKLTKTKVDLAMKDSIRIEFRDRILNSAVYG